jgi:hypothetical protein
MRVAEGGGARDVGSKRGEIRILANFQRSDARLEPQSAGTTNRRELEGLVRTKGVVTLGRSTMDQNSQTGFVENVHAVVAGDRIRADTDAHSRGDEGEKWSYPVTEFRVRRGTVRHPAAAASDDLYVGIIHTHAMNEERTPVERSLPIQ